MAVTDLNDAIMKEIPTLIDEGITSLKLFMAYKNVFQVDDATLFNTMRVAAEHGMIVMVHAENGDVEAALTPALLAMATPIPSITPPRVHRKSKAKQPTGLWSCLA